MNCFSPIFYLSLPLLLALSACSSPPAERYAKQFCDCSAEIADALVRQRADKISAAEFAGIRDEYLQCMGEIEDPRLELTQEETNAFEQEYLLHIRQNCPNIGRNFGYQLD